MLVRRTGKGPLIESNTTDSRCGSSLSITTAALANVAWTDVAGFELGAIRGAKMIAIIYAPQYEGQKMGRALAENLSGMEGAIANNYNAPLGEVLKALDEWRVRYGNVR